MWVGDGPRELGDKMGRKTCEDWEFVEVDVNCVLYTERNFR